MTDRKSLLLLAKDGYWLWKINKINRNGNWKYALDYADVDLKRGTVFFYIGQYLVFDSEKEARAKVYSKMLTDADGKHILIN